MPLSLSKSRLCEIIRGNSVQSSPVEPDGRLVFRGVEFDSRLVRGGELFVALKGASNHGHEFVGEAFARGAALALVEQGFPRIEEHRLVVCGDSLKAFGELAAWWRRELNIPVFAVTGSVGKTTVKEIAAHLLLGVSPGAYSRKSHNNHTGVPYTICGFGPEHQWAVVEMGMNHAGELSALTKIVTPDLAAITMIGAAHIEAFESLNDIAAAKFEIAESLAPEQPLLLRDDDSYLASQLTKFEPTRFRAVKYFGTSDRASVRITDLASSGLEGISFSLTSTVRGVEERAKVRMSLLGTQNAYNAACAVLAAQIVQPETPLERLAERLTSFTAPLMRMNLKEWSNGRFIIDDSYNANPASMKAFLELAHELTQAGKRVGLVVGDMKELGKHSEFYHREAGQGAAAAKPVFLVAAGEFAEMLIEPAGRVGLTVHGAADAAHAANCVARLAAEMPCDIVMIKASRGVGLDRVTEKLLDLSGTKLG